MNPIFLIDFYKVGHVNQYPKDVTQVWSNWTPRKSRVEGSNEVVFFGLQYFIKKYLQREFFDEFFVQPWTLVEQDYKELISSTLGDKNLRTDHIKALHELGYLPIEIWALPEGVSSPVGVPQLVVTNTDPRFFWLPNYLETLMSNILWKPSTSATTARIYRKLFERHAREAGETDLGFVDWQGHDFSMRGMSGVEDAILSGLGHLLSFSGTDTVPAILAAREYYGAPLTVGGSVAATEHSVMSAGGMEDEFETFKRLITEVYPTGIVSIVSDTWDLWKVLTDFVPRLRETILARDGKVVIRPDSGDPVKIIIGDNEAGGPAFWGAAHLLAIALGVSGHMKRRMINKGGLIYGDSITPERADAILTGLRRHYFSSFNMVFGIGSYTYEYVTRDTYGFAMKATAVRRGGEVVPIFKKPVTDSGEKTSLKGIPAVYHYTDLSAVNSSFKITKDTPGNGEYIVRDMATESQFQHCAFKRVFADGELLVEHTFEEVRGRARA